MYDLVLKGGNVIDPSSGLNGVADVAVQAGAIARIAPTIGMVEATRTIDVTGKIVTPGLSAVQALVSGGVTRTAVTPELAGVYAGVTPSGDAGRSGSATCGPFPRHVIPSCQTEIIPFLHICQTGLSTMPDII